ncbi:two-component system sensor histidine kinase YesM [Paenibacillus phyllosphaerae]|uniref:Two-component system sensor histidine kinase YesM n=1 Tax=Paenibacillus phyllosphaerae TaxID=274593 RepID=A0A7W5AYU2_9BACL|nr:histidine kinase [Paenibacillus phyllosphaerae]MBB3111290.1 two-component system sensor histidine kinase YesM [Paenibacillus phyllosphaerae]
MTIWFRHLMQWLRQPRIRSRFFTAMILVSLPPLFVLGYVSFNIAKETLVQNHMQTNQGHLKTSSEVADLLLRNIINMNRIILSNDELRKELYASGTSGNEQAVLDVRTANKLQNIVVSNLFDTQNIDSICLFDRNFRSVCYGRSEQAGQYGSDETRGQIAQTDWFERAVKAKGKEVFFGYNVLEGSSSSSSFSSVKLLRDPNRLSGSMIGLLVINIKKSIFDQAVNEDGQSGFLVIDTFERKPVVVYDYRPELTAEIGLGDSLDATLASLESSGFIYSQYKNSTSGWMFLQFVETDTLLRQSDRIGTFTMMMAGLMAGIALMVSYFVSGTITRPLLQLKKMIVDWAMGSTPPDNQEAFVADEVGAIGQTFRRMAAANQQLSDRLLSAQLKEREAELRSLQAQIKPHFLYNTLDSIYFMALLEEKEDIAQMALSLSESFKLSLNKGKELIPVFKELKHIEHYMIIQNMRYDNRFQYVEEVEEGIKSFEMMKLLLQPLVENAIYHGLEPKVGDGWIKLTGRIDGEFLVFTISDNGVGMDDIHKTEQGYGMRNVRDRLTLFYGPTSSFTIKSKVDEGTTVELRFPHNERKVEHAYDVEGGAVR